MTSLPASDPAVARRARRSDLGRVVFWMTGALVAFCAMAISIRSLSGALNVFEILAIRNAAGIVMLAGAALVRPELRPHLVPRRMDLHALRNVVHFGGQYAWALSITLLPLATVFALEFTVPAWTMLLAVLFLGERITVSRIGAVIFGFLGVLVILRPGLDSFRPAALLVLAAALSFAVTLTTTKKLTGTVSTFAILFWMNVIQLPLAMLGADPLFVLKLGTEQIPGLIGICLGGLASHMCVTNAFRSGDAILVVPMDFLRIPLIALLGWAIYGEVLDPLVFAGATLIIVGVLWNLVGEAKGR